MLGYARSLISPEDISSLRDWLETEAMRLLAHTNEVHIIVSGVGIAYAVAADVLNNWKTLYFYHNDKSGYQPWYYDKKSAMKSLTPNPMKENR